MHVRGFCAIVGRSRDNACRLLLFINLLYNIYTHNIYTIIYHHHHRHHRCSYSQVIPYGSLALARYYTILGTIIMVAKISPVLRLTAVTQLLLESSSMKVHSIHYTRDPRSIIIGTLWCALARVRLDDVYHCEHGSYDATPCALTTGETFYSARYYIFIGWPSVIYETARTSFSSLRNLFRLVRFRFSFAVHISYTTAVCPAQQQSLLDTRPCALWPVSKDP